MPHAHYVKQFQAYYELMRSRTELGLASDTSQMVEMSFLTPEGSSYPEVGGIDDGCCLGFTLVRALMFSASLNVLWDQMLEVVDQWDGTYDTLQESRQIFIAGKSIAMTVGDIFRMVMCWVVGLQHRQNMEYATWDDESLVSSSLLDNAPYLLAALDWDIRREPIFERRTYNQASLVLLLEDAGFQAKCSKPVELSDMKHMTFLQYSDESGWWFYNVNHETYACCTKDVNVVATAILEDLSEQLKFAYIHFDESVIAHLFSESEPLLELLNTSTSAQDSVHNLTLQQLEGLSDLDEDASDHDLTLQQLEELSDLDEDASDHDLTLQQLEELSDDSVQVDAFSSLTRFSFYQPAASEPADDTLSISRKHTRQG